MSLYGEWEWNGVWPRCFLHYKQMEKGNRTYGDTTEVDNAVAVICAGVGVFGPHGRRNAWVAAVVVVERSDALLKEAVVY